MSQSGSSTAGSIAQSTPEPTASRTEERVSIRKRKAIKYGRKIARLRIGRTKEIFTIHEELLCSHSPYFREKLQKRRKHVGGECPMCHDEMDPTRKEITFCSSGCGANIHHECMKSWKQQKSARSEAITCPLCRQLWPSENNEQSLQCPNLDGVSFDYYQEWLYHHTILLQHNESSIGDDDTNEEESYVLINAYLLGLQVRDAKFCKDVLQALIEVCNETECIPGSGPISRVYRATKEKSCMRRFLVDIYVVQAEPDWFMDDVWSEYPSKFMADLTMALLRRRRDSQNIENDMATLKTTHCVIDEDADQELDSDATSWDSD